MRIEKKYVHGHNLVSLLFRNAELLLELEQYQYLCCLQMHRRQIHHKSSLNAIDQGIEYPINNKSPPLRQVSSRHNRIPWSCPQTLTNSLQHLTKRTKNQTLAKANNGFFDFIRPVTGYNLQQRSSCFRGILNDTNRISSGAQDRGHE